MSYILDALRRADAERGRGSVPSIHTQQQFTPLEAEDDSERAPSRRAWWISAVLALILLGGVAWVLLRPQPAPSVAAVPHAVVPLPAAQTPPTAALPVPAATDTGGPPVSAAASTAAAHARAEPARAPSATAERHARSGRETRAPQSDADESPAVRAAAAPARDRAPPARPERPAPAAAEGDRVYAVRELPEDVRRALPTIAVSGSTWSNDSASRMLMIGGQIYHEGDSVAPGVALERIKPHAAVLAFRGYRYELTF